jgi:ribose transport system permease protein
LSTDRQQPAAVGAGSPATPGAPPPPATSLSSHARAWIARYGVLIIFVATFATFSLLKPDSFFTVVTMKAILRDSIPLMIIALGVTVVLVMNEFDLSAAGLISLSATVVIVLISTEFEGINYVLAIVLTLLIGAGLGTFNGLLVSYVRLPSFIITIAMSTVYAGLALLLVDSKSVFEGIDPSYVKIATGTFLGFSNQVFIGLVIVILMHVFMRMTETGRYMYATGGNPEAARLSGVRVQFLKAAGFAIVGLAAAVTAILLTSQAGADNPNTGSGDLLPAYAAAYLGSTMFGRGLFTPLGTALGALYLQVVGTGLLILNFSGPLVQIIQGGILALAVLVSRFART